MTNELEKQFFQCFGIEPKCEDGTCDMDDECRYTDCNTCQRINKFNYPQITYRILLELICICNSTYINGYTNYFMATGKTKEGLKEEILKKCIALSKDIKYQVRTLFEEG